MINTKGFFDHIFKNTKENSILILDTNGVILDINKGFMLAFGYTKKMLVGKNFELLFTKQDRENDKPGIEIRTSLKKGSRSDNNYLLNKDGLPIWVLGESVLAVNDDGKKFIVKIIQNINTQKKLEGFLIESNEFIHTVFDSVKDAGFVILNSELNILRTNKMFLRLFELKKAETENIKLIKLPHHFWQSAEIKKHLSGILVTNDVMKNVTFQITTSTGKIKYIEVTSKLMENAGMGRTILLVIRLK